MNRQIAIIKDIIRNSPHAVIIKDGEYITCKSLTSYGQSIIDSCFKDNDIVETLLPAGFTSTGYHNITPALETVSGISFESGTKSVNINTFTVPEKLYSGQRLKDRKILSNRQRSLSSISVFDTNINKYRFNDTKTSAVAFKATMFKKEIFKKRMILDMKQNSMSFNPRNNTVVASKSLDGIDVVISKFVSRWSSGKIRRAMKEKSLSKSVSTSRRVARHADILTQINREENETMNTNSRFLV